MTALDAWWFWLSSWTHTIIGIVVGVVAAVVVVLFVSTTDDAGRSQ